MKGKEEKRYCAFPKAGRAAPRDFLYAKGPRLIPRGSPYSQIKNPVPPYSFYFNYIVQYIEVIVITVLGVKVVTVQGTTLVIQQIWEIRYLYVKNLK